MSSQSSVSSSGTGSPTWLDRVFAWGRVYTSQVRYDRGHFKGKRALVSVTTGASAMAYGPDGRCGDLDLVLWPVHFALSYVGFSVLPPFHSFDVASSRTSDPKVVHARLEGHKAGFRQHLARLESFEPLRFNGWDDWDERGRLKPGAPSYSPFIGHAA